MSRKKHHHSRRPPHPCASTDRPPRLTVGTHVVDGITVVVVPKSEWTWGNFDHSRVMAADLDAADLLDPDEATSS